MKRKVIIEIETDESGEYCQSLRCPSITTSCMGGTRCIHFGGLITDRQHKYHFSPRHPACLEAEKEYKEMNNAIQRHTKRTD
jgi:hypothetical protein